MSKTRTTIYLDNEVKSKFDIYKTQKDVNLSELVNKLLKDHLDNPFKWENHTLYDYITKLEGEI